MPQAIDFGSVSNAFSGSTGKLEDALGAKFEQGIDTTNMSEVIQLQSEVSQITMMYGMQSALFKSLKDTTQGIIQKIN